MSTGSVNNSRNALYSDITTFLSTTIPSTAAYVSSYFPIIHNIAGHSIGTALANIREIFGFSFPSVKRSKILAKEVAVAQNRASLEAAKKLLKEEINKSLELLQEKNMYVTRQQDDGSGSHVKQNKYL